MSKMKTNFEEFKVKFKRFKNKFSNSQRTLLARVFWMLLAISIEIYLDAPFFFVIASWYLILIWLQLVTKYKYSSKFENFILIFLILANFMGSSSGWDFYDTVPWRDEMLHFLYGMAFTFLWFRLIYAVFSKRHIKQYIGIILSFAFCFSVAGGAVWEIYEYSMDRMFGAYYIANDITLMQADKGSWEDAITDTMNDIILETLSAIVMCLILFGFLKYGRFNAVWNFEIVVWKIEKKDKKEKTD